MLYKAVGEVGRKIEDTEKEYGFNNECLIPVGADVEVAYRMPFYEIIIDQEIVGMDVFSFWFWQGLKEAGIVEIDVARKTFVEQTGLDEDIFNDTFEFLLSKGVIVPSK